jgi:hypothetical protein
MKRPDRGAPLESMHLHVTSADLVRYCRSKRLTSNPITGRTGLAEEIGP